MFIDAKAMKLGLKPSDGTKVLHIVLQTVDTYRLPDGHIHNRLDQRFQKPSLWFHGEDAHEYKNTRKA